VLPPYNDPNANRVDVPGSAGDGGVEKGTPGFEGKPKGMMQVLFETGWLDPNSTVKMVGTIPTLNKVTGMRKDNGKEPPKKEHVASLVLGSRADFRDELSELSKVREYPNSLLSFAFDSLVCHANAWILS
jgi:hypothetical protein